MPWIEGAGDPLIKEIERLRLDVRYWQARAETLENQYAALFPIGEAPGRIVMHLWNGAMWIRLADKSFTAEGQQWTSAVQDALSGPVQDVSEGPVERARRNNVVT